MTNWHHWLWIPLSALLTPYLIAGLIAYFWQDRDWPTHPTLYTLTLLTTLALITLAAIVFIFLQVIRPKEVTLLILLVLLLGGSIATQILAPIMTSPSINWTSSQQTTYGVICGILNGVYALWIDSNLPSKQQPN